MSLSPTTRSWLGLVLSTIFQKLDRSAIKVYLSLEFAFRDNSDDAFAKIFTRAIPRSALATPSLEKSLLLVKKTCRERKSQIQVPETHSIFLQRAQQHGFHCRSTRQQSRSFARWSQSLTHSQLLVSQRRDLPLDEQERFVKRAMKRNTCCRCPQSIPAAIASRPKAQPRAKWR